MSSRCALPSRVDLFGFEMNGGVAAKIIDAGKFLNWSSWWYLTPHLLPRFLFLYLAMGNLVFFLHVLKHTTAYGVGLDGMDAKLLAFLMATYTTTLITRYYLATREKGAGYCRGTMSFVNSIMTVID